MLDIGVYNEAGERIRTVIVVRTSQSMGEVNTSVNGDDSAILVTGQLLQLHLPGVETPETLGKGESFFYWDGKNDSGQYVANGPYYLKLSEKDTWGHTIISVKETSF